MKVTGWTSVMTVVLMALVLVLGPSITGVEAGSRDVRAIPRLPKRVYNGRPGNRPSAGAIRRCSRPPCRRPHITSWFFG
ncbi:uncharacterized protein LOC126999780 isoform X4 [Eriocheir sinensis]|uniref:uncharacterized protein LOC126999780 isoform X4 n=1 Tax=Eriocheir sinensis TaxID=95602 RepID=UPI0021C9496C|nr:uncharacterized protein LOC126999780 isoform X4 [Eriocheir sinensis]XP_050718641.1 uncharacterized protein LOC126999780 isoform X4 [Eriocheir sinensis]